MTTYSPSPARHTLRTTRGERVIRLYFISDTGAAYLDADTDVQARAATAKFLRTMPDYRECTQEEW